MITHVLSNLTDTELESRLTSLVGRERAITAELLVHLAEFDARRLYLGAGFASLFTYCCGVLRLSEGEAYNRIEVARIIRRFPRVLELLRKGALSLTTARMLAPHLAEDSAKGLLEQASSKSKREVEELLAAQFPRPAVPTSVRRVPVPGTGSNTPSTEPAPSLLLGDDAREPAAVPTPVPQTTGRAHVAPLSSDHFLVKFTASAETRNKLRQAQDLLRHAIPSGDVAQIVDRALTLLLADLTRRRFAATDRPRLSKGPAHGSRQVAARVKRATWARDGGRCAFVGKNGRRCNERAFVEFHHVDPFVLDGTASVDGHRPALSGAQRVRGEAVLR